MGAVAVEADGADLADGAAHLQLCRGYLERPEPDYLKAREHGEQALAAGLARGESAVYAPALVYLGACYVHLRRLAAAIQLLERYRELLPTLGPAEAALAGEALLQLGLAHSQRGQHPAARAALAAARAWFTERGESARAEACRRYLTEVCLRQQDYPAVLALLQAGEHYVALHPRDQTARCALHLARGEYELATGNVIRAIRAANTALAAAGSDPVQCYECYMLLLRCAQHQGHHKDVLNFALSARVMALDARRYDLDFQATVVFIELFRSLGEAAGTMLRELDEAYQRRGLDIYRYLPESLVRRHGPTGG